MCIELCTYVTEHTFSLVWDWENILPSLEVLRMQVCITEHDYKVCIPRTQSLCVQFHVPNNCVREREVRNQEMVENAGQWLEIETVEFSFT